MATETGRGRQADRRTTEGQKKRVFDPTEFMTVMNVVLINPLMGTGLQYMTRA